jgi:hypothetical protein
MKKLFLIKREKNYEKTRWDLHLYRVPVHMLLVGSSHNSDEANYALRSNQSRGFNFKWQFGASSDLLQKR